MTLYFTRFTFSTSQLCRLAMVFKVTHLNIRKILEITILSGGACNQQ